MPRQSPDRHEARREQILGVCQQCFAAKGFHQTSMRDICAALEMSPGALYRYFDSKESIIAAMIDADRAKMEKIFAAIPFETPFPKLVDQLVTSTLESFVNDEPIALFNQINAEGTVNPKIADALKIHYGVMTDRMELLIRRAQERKEIDPDVKPRDAAVFMMATFDGLCPRSAFDPSVNWRKMARVFTNLMLKALGSVNPKSSGGKP
ncbi:MAG: TetR/AcrR family transcriptional regulator [Akkermansiaceae bacterium]|jgi:AcrR family transcriptional regulator|nr:TetR/AcrR family transcriptional regulator [Akkermansiaceae bacterium]